MFKIKKKFMRFTCCLLAMAIIISAMPLSFVSAAESKDTLLSELKEMAAEAAEDQKEYAEEAICDAISPASNNDWAEAVFIDKLGWGYFHNAVQEHVRDTVSKMKPRELRVAVKFSKDGNPTKIGRADLWMQVGKTRYIWEVKPASYKEDPNKTKGLNQLNGYINGISEDELDKKPEERSEHKNGKESGIKIPKTEFNLGKYKVTYIGMGNGLILYTFEKNKEEEEKETEEAVEKASAKDEAKNEVAEEAAGQSGVVFDNGAALAAGAVAGAAAGAVAGLTEAGIAAAKNIALKLNLIHGPIAKTNTLSAATVSACTAFLLVVGSSSAVASAAEVEAYEDFKTFLEVYYGPDLLAEYIKALEDGDQDKIDEIMRRIQNNSDDYEDAGEAQPPRDPLIIDLGEEGIELKSLEHGVNFDLDNNGFAEKTAWIGTDDGFLALDRNGNGKIDNGGELFGDQVVMKDGSKSTSGFAALKELDDNEDGVIDGKDAEFEKLLIWIDGNHNGKTDSGELNTLEQSNVESISLDYHEVSLVDDETGTRIAETADVSINNGDTVMTTQISEFWFPVNSSDTTQGDKVTAGNVPDILKAIDADESGELYDLCVKFININDATSKRYYLKKILYFITNAADVPVNSRGGNIDARDLKVIEQFMGRDFVGVDGTNPNVNAASILKEIYMDIENQYYNMLNIYAAFGGYLKAVYEYEDEYGNKKLDLSFLYYVIGTKIDDRDDVDTLIYDLGVYLSSFDKAHGTNYYGDFSKKFSALSSHYADIIALSKSGNTYMGTDKSDSYGGTNHNDFIFGLEGNDTLSGADGNDSIDGGNGDDVISGGAGNDILSGKEGKDTLDGGAGNDILKGSKGDDTYVFAKGYGNDTVIDIYGENTLYFKGISVKDVRVNGVDDNNAVICIKGTKDTLTLSDFCKGEEYCGYNLKFEDAFMHVAAENSPFHYIYGDDEDDILKAVVDGSYMYGGSGDDIITGSEGNDVIYGNKGDDNIYSGKGDDKIFAGAGDDILDGGEGNDFLYGGKGNDIYIFGRDYGTDVINDTKGETIVKLSKDISLSDLDICQVGENAVICIKNTEDKLIINSYLVNQENYFLQIGDEKILIMEHVSDEENKFYSGSESNDYYVNDGKEFIAGGKGSDRIIGMDSMEYVFGDNGNDQLLSNGGNDVIYGDKGNDYINAGDGNDYIDAGAGDDFIDGGNGDDNYIFCRGYGKDSIMDSDGKNTILFGDGFKPDAIKAYRHNWNDLLITFDGVDDSLNIKNYCISEKARSFNLVFADGTVVNAVDKASPLRTIYGTDGSEYMTSIYADGITKIGQDGNDQLVGSDGEDFLYGGKGDDRITGNGGNDVLDGGEGNDYLYGGEGNDTYIFKQGYGTDTIGDGKGVNTIDIYGYTQAQIKAYRTNWNNITITFKDSNDKLVIEGFFNSESDRNFYLSFNGGVKVHATASGSPLRTIYGTDNSEYILAMDDRGVTILGESGDDSLNGGNGADNLYGGAGADQLYGNGGNDILDGGKGNDYLYGGAGKDTYIFNKGYGMDTIIDSEGINTISFGDGLLADQITAYRTNWNDLTVTFKDIDDKLVITGYFTSESNRKFNVHFANGLKFACDDADNPIKQVHATKYDDWMGTWSDDGIIFYGDNGNDHLTGGKGDDTLCGGKGTDYLSGNEGNDTYIFGNGYGMDTIEDNDGANKVIFSDIVLNKVTFQVKKNGELVISVKGTDDTLTIKNFSSDLYTFEFANGMAGTVNEGTAEFTETVVE